MQSIAGNLLSWFGILLRNLGKHGFLLCRSGAERLSHVYRGRMTRLYEQGRLLLNQGIQNQQISTEGAARLVSALADQETALRLAQLCAEQFRHSQAWVQLTADLLQDVEQQTPVWLTTIARLSQAKLQTPGGDSDCIDSLAASEALCNYNNCIYFI
ncbi:unnamed protein product [Protopolystoma xenopodis]|uniref:Uncharacterized protein n=1 Tax=Protopolystoma xenopodis TaxID=117903 RepID=A0A448WLX8_9PLAT|nr:unnamed protein product [Protopolystoma xenopodis]